MSKTYFKAPLVSITKDCNWGLSAQVCFIRALQKLGGLIAA